MYLKISLHQRKKSKQPKMSNRSLRIITWNANGLNQRIHELEIFLRTNNIDIALISETHFSNKNYIRIRGFCAYWTTHPSERSRGGTAILIKQSIQHYQQEKIKENNIQATIVAINYNGAELNIGAIYCPPRNKNTTKITKMRYKEIFTNFGHRFIIGGDFNVKHTAWGCRLISPGGGNELLGAITESRCEFHSSCSATYWPTDSNKIPDLLDFFISRGIATNFMEVNGIGDLTSDHTPVLLSLSSSVIKKTKKQNLTNKYTDWEKFREKVESMINLVVRLRTKTELERQTMQFIEILRQAAAQATPALRDRLEREVIYPADIIELIKNRRRARRIWHRTRSPADKTIFNRLSNNVNRRIKDYKQNCFEKYLMELGPEAEKDYSLWKATRRLKRPLVQVPPIRNARGHWTGKNDEKAEIFAQHLETVFQPHNGPTNVDSTPVYQPIKLIKPVTPMEVAIEIDNLNPKKAPGIDELSPGLLKELPRKAVIMLTYLFNACFRLKYIPRCFKIAQIIMIKKPDKPAEQVTSYRPISLLPSISKLFEKLFLRRLKPLINIPDFQFGFRGNHSTIDQVHRVTTVIEKAFEEKKYCPAVFLDVSQAFDKVWHRGLIYKMSKLLPQNVCQLLESYLFERKFRVSQVDAFSNIHPIQAGVPQGSVLGPLLYIIYTADIPVTQNTFIGTFADDTVIMSTGDSQQHAIKNLQLALDKINNWTLDWKIKLNELKSVHVTYALRRINNNLHTYLNGVQIPQQNSAKYLGLHLDNRLNWKHHVRQKAEQIKIKQRQMYWLVGHYSKLNLYSKRLIYLSIIKPIFTYGIQLWGCTKQSNRDIIQRSQNKFLRMITNAYRYVTNLELHNDLGIAWINDVICDYAIKHEKRLLNHTNVEAIKLLDITHELRRLKRLKPHELTWVILNK